MSAPAARRDVVLTVLRRVGGGVTVPELVYKTGFAESEVVDALCELEARGLAVPWSWTAVRDAA